MIDLIVHTTKLQIELLFNQHAHRTADGEWQLPAWLQLLYDASPSGLIEEDY